MNLPVTIIIPTYNRKESLLRAVASLQAQTYPQELMEVIIVSDGGADGTAEAVAGVQTGFSLRCIEQKKAGAAAARNTGAKEASGSILIFLDDDIEASPGLVAAHVKANEGVKNRVVIGYLPPVVYCKHPFLAPKLREWWEVSFQTMRQKSHRFHYRNLTSGNVSLSKILFNEVGGFNDRFICQEDYELGLRLILQKAEFRFEDAAMGIHHERTELEKSLKRRQQEGIAVILFARQYQQLIPTTAFLQRVRRGLKRKERILFFGAFRFSLLIHIYSRYLRVGLNLSERLRRRGSWERFYQKILDLYYLRGIAMETGSMEQLNALARSSTQTADEQAKPLLKIDLKNGIKEAEQKLDEIRPAQVDLYFGKNFIGSMVQQYGFEPFKGAHLRAVLAHKFGWEILEAIAFENTGGGKANDAEKFFSEINSTDAVILHRKKNSPSCS